MCFAKSLTFKTVRLQSLPCACSIHMELDDESTYEVKEKDKLPCQSYEVKEKDKLPCQSLNQSQNIKIFQVHQIYTWNPIFF